MALDAICLQSVVRELKSQIVGARIEKIQQPARDQIVLLLRGSRRLLVCAGVGQPRLHLTRLLRDNPSQPPMFCMLLRKYLAGGASRRCVRQSSSAWWSWRSRHSTSSASRAASA